MFKKKRRKVKPFGLILAIIMALQMMGTTAFAYSARTTAPAANNSYYYSSANPFYSAGFTGNCTWYAWGRAYEILGTSPNLSRHDANTWYSYNASYGYYNYGTEPKVGAIACYFKNGNNHVAVVEEITDGVAYVSEFNQGGDHSFHYRIYNAWNAPPDGYIYLVNDMPVTPPAAPDITKDYLSGNINTTSNMEYSLDGGNTWRDCSGTLNVSNWYDIDFVNIRYKANGNTPAGYQTVVNINRYSKPNAAVDYYNETISATNKMAFTTAGGSGDCYDNMSLSSLYWNGSEMYAYIWVKASSTAFKSNYQTVYIPARPVAPVGIGKIDGTSANSGKLTGVSDTMQYKSENGSWTDCDGNEVIGLAAGTYYVRYKATNSSFASEAVTLTIENKTVSGESNLEITVPSFSSVEEGYERPEAKAITISNTGDADAEITSVEVDNTEAFEISGNGTMVRSNDSIDTYTIQPKEGLSAGTYNGTITVKYDNNKTATYDISFVVTEKAIVGESKLNVIAPSFSSVEEGYERPEAKAITISNTGDADAEITNVEVDNTEAFEISGNGTTIGSNDSIDTYAIQPKEGLSAGIYNGTVTVEYDNGKTATAKFTFTVTEKGIVIETQTPPSAPKLESRTKTSITLKKIKDNENGAKAEYRIDGGKWQSSNVFKGLEPDTKYVFEARYAAVDNFEASEPSEAAKISTAKKSSGGSGPSYTLDKVENSNSNTNKNDKPETKPEETKKSIFADVSLDNPNYDAIVKAYEKGYMVGTSENTFAPDGFLTRGMAAQIIWNIAGNPEPSDVSPFLDVTSDMYYAKAVAWAYERGIVLGYDITKFGPDDFVTIEQFDIMMAKYNSEAAAPYTGVSPNATRGYVASRIAL
ncbi:S-layer homology domain-containing protein [Anaerotignum sp. MSJ-24]|uniref:S-layer homology domain-containing protein n=1 Tax=Anaerotignum sp. MSJ-24 TaxID=2841521 RepID=UPI001C1101ED|nr:S-layer homology domain-containing protein [Anaerotignum sp. MSJ-24]MBU5463876.1 S-layer homology domain-containing protein [Anaerotignum sp. MSJ-24]